jgi:hypothetical protein
MIAAILLRKSTSLIHSGGFAMMHSIALFDVLFIFMMALKALGNTHSKAASSPTLESRPS